MSKLSLSRAKHQNSSLISKIFYTVTHSTYGQVHHRIFKYPPGAHTSHPQGAATCGGL